jgi:hypothetical protein
VLQSSLVEMPWQAETQLTMLKRPSSSSRQPPFPSVNDENKKGPKGAKTF